MRRVEEDNEETICGVESYSKARVGGVFVPSCQGGET